MRPREQFGHSFTRFPIVRYQFFCIVFEAAYQACDKFSSEQKRIVATLRESGFA